MHSMWVNSVKFSHRIGHLDQIASIYNFRDQIDPVETIGTKMTQRPNFQWYVLYLFMSVCHFFNGELTDGGIWYTLQTLGGLGNIIKTWGSKCN